MTRQEIYDEVKEAFGIVPGYFAEAPDAVLEQWWSATGWGSSDTALSARDKALVGFGAAAAVHCQY
jgi:hypothetical protein